MHDDVILQQKTGPAVGDWSDVQTVPAQIDMAGGSGGESLRFGADTATGFYTIYLRYREDIRSDWRIVHAQDGRVFQVVSYGDPDGKRQALRVSATTIQ